jgi:hypothetical protein
MLFLALVKSALGEDKIGAWSPDDRFQWMIHAVELIHAESDRLLRPLCRIAGQSMYRSETTRCGVGLIYSMTLAAGQRYPHWNPLPPNLLVAINRPRGC